MAEGTRGAPAPAHNPEEMGIYSIDQSRFGNGRRYYINRGGYRLYWEEPGEDFKNGAWVVIET